MSHPPLVVNRHALFARMKQPASVGPVVAQGDPLPGHRQEIFMQVTAEGSPYGVVVADAKGALLGAISREPQASELDHDFVGPERNGSVDAEHRRPQIECHPWKYVYEEPPSGREARPADALLRPVVL